MIRGTRTRQRFVGLLMGGTLLALAGCRAAMPAADSATTQPSVPRNGAELVEFITEQPYVAAEPGYRAVYSFWKGESFMGEYEALRDELVAGRIVGESWEHKSSDLLNKAEVGFMVCRAANIRSGFNWLLTGLGRYAWRELIYKDIAEESSEFGFMTGGEFVGILSRAEEYRRRTGRSDSTVELEAPAEESPLDEVPTSQPAK